MDMTPSQLRAFHLVAEAGSFSAAARDSGLSQPNLSGQVTALEKAYGVRLFDRRGRQVVPTETGRQLQGITTRLFAVQDEAQALLAGEQTLTRGHLRIAADSAHHVVPIMAALKKKAASLTFQLSIDTSANGSRKLTPAALTKISTAWCCNTCCANDLANAGCETSHA